MACFDHFEWLSQYYDRLFKSSNPDRIIKLVDLPISGSILDAGGGTGRISQQLVGMASSIVVVDYSLGMLRQASGKNGLQTVCAQTEKIPFPTSSFDRIIMVDAFHHVINQSNTLQELWRVVKPGGKIVIEEPDVRNFKVKILAVVEKLLLMRSQFVNPLRIANMVRFPNTHIRVDKDGYTAWIIMEKTS